MVLSGRAEYIFPDGKSFKLIMEWSATQNIAANQSTVTATLKVQSLTSYAVASGWANKVATISINGNSESQSVNVNIGATQTKTLWSRTVNVPHDANGSKSFNITTSVNYSGITWSGSPMGTYSAGGNFVLNDIPRAYDFIYSKNNVELDEAFTLKIFQNNSGMKATARIQIGTMNYIVRDSCPIDQNFNITASSVTFGPQFQGTQSMAGRVIIETYNGTTKIGEKSHNFTFKLPSTGQYAPEIQSIIMNDVSGLPEVLKIPPSTMWVNNYSKLEFTINATAGSGATISYYQITFANGKQFTSTSNVIMVDTVSEDIGVGNLQPVCKVVNSRGDSKEFVYGFPLTAYSPPRISIFNAGRLNNGSTIQFAISVSHTSLDQGLNPLGGQLFSRLVGTSAWGFQTQWLNDTIPTAYTLGGFPTANGYEFLLQVSDKLSTTSSVVSIGSARVLMDFNKDVGVGIGKAHTQGVLDVGGAAYFSGAINTTVRVNSTGPVHTDSYLEATGHVYTKGNLIFEGTNYATLTPEDVKQYGWESVSLWYGTGSLFVAKRLGMIHLKFIDYKWTGTGQMCTIPYDYRMKMDLMFNMPIWTTRTGVIERFQFAQSSGALLKLTNQAATDAITGYASFPAF